MINVKNTFGILLGMFSCAFSYAQHGLVITDNAYLVIDNGANVVIENPATNAITSINGANIVSENENDVIKWNIGTATGQYNIPFTNANGTKIPLTVNATTAGTGTGSLILSTFETLNDDNTNYPTGVANLQMACNADNGLAAIDRFWRIDANNFTAKPGVNINFGYDDAAAEMGGTNTITEAALKAVRYNDGNNLWEAPQFIYGVANATNNVVNNATVAAANFYKYWTLVDTNSFIIPVVANAIPNDTICVGDSVTLFGTGATNYAWDNGVTDNVTFAPANTADYIVIGDDNGCYGLDTINVFVTPLPTVVANALPNDTICEGDNVTLFGTGATNYTWDNGVTDNVAFAPANTNTYTVTGTLLGCSNTATIDVYVNALPTVVANVTPNSTICEGDNVTLFGTGATNYTWDNGVTDNVAFAPANTNTYTVTGTLLGCSNTATIDVYVNALPTVVANVTPNSTICEGDNVTLFGTGATNYTWDNGVTDNVAFAPANTNTYTVTGFDQNGCSATAFINVVVNALPLFTLDAFPNVVYAGEESELSATGANSYVWNSANSTTDLSCTNCSDPIATPLQTTIYTVTAEDLGCYATDTISVTVINGVEIPEGFSPNSDGVADTWYIKGMSRYKNSVVKVFNRWGNEVFSTSAYNNSWDGTYNSSALPEGTYFYIVDLGDDSEKFNGYVYLNR